MNTDRLPRKTRKTRKVTRLQRNIRRLTSADTGNIQHSTLNLQLLGSDGKIVEVVLGQFQNRAVTALHTLRHSVYVVFTLGRARNFKGKIQ